MLGAILEIGKGGPPLTNLGGLYSNLFYTGWHTPLGSRPGKIIDIGGQVEGKMEKKPPFKDPRALFSNPLGGGALSRSLTLRAPFGGTSFNKNPRGGNISPLLGQSPTCNFRPL